MANFRRKIFWYLLLAVPILLLILGYIFPVSFFKSQEEMRLFIESYGFFAPILFILIQIVQVVVTPLSHYAVSLAGGFLFGTWYGFIYNWIGRVIGTYIAFCLGRRFGRKILRHVVSNEMLTKFDKIFDKGRVILFLMYFLPLFPDDELSYLAGFSRIRKKIFIIIMALGHIGGSLGLAYLGSGASRKDPLFIIFSLATLVSGILFVVFYKRFINKEENKEYAA